MDVCFNTIKPKIKESTVRLVFLMDLGSVVCGQMEPFIIASLVLSLVSRPNAPAVVISCDRSVAWGQEGSMSLAVSTRLEVGPM